MGQEAINNILEGLRIGQARRAETERQGLEWERNLAQKEHNEKQIELEHKRLDQENQHFLLAQKAAKAMQDVQIAMHKQQIVDNINKGVPVPGDQVTPGVGNPDEAKGGFSPINPNQATTQVHNLPDGLGQVTLDTPTQRATKEANLARITNAPGEEVKTREELAKQKAETERQVRVAQENGMTRIQEAHEMNQYRLQLEKLNQDANNARNAATNDMHMNVAKLMLSGGLGSDGFQAFPAAQLIQDGLNGRLSEEQIKKQYPKQAAGLFSAARNSGALFITQAEQDKLKDFEAVASAVPLIQELNQIRNDSTTNALVPFTAAYKTYKAKEEELMGKLPAISRIISGVKRFNSQEMNQYINQLVPGRSPSSTSAKDNADKLKRFVQDDVQDAFNTNFSRLPKQQQDILRQNVGLTNLPYISGAMKTTPGTNNFTPTQPNKTRPPLTDPKYRIQ